MGNPVPAWQYIHLGKLLHFLLYPANCAPKDYGDGITRFRDQLVICELPHARAAASVFEGLSLPWDLRTNRLTTTTAAQCEMTLRTIEQTLKTEAAAKHTIVLDNDGVSERLRGLTGQVTLTDAQLQLLHETIRCIECGSYRSAMVMGWNLVYDYFRFWLFTNRLADFNNGLVSNYVKRRTNTPVYDPIAYYDDFFLKDAPAEKIVLEVAFDEQLIPGELYDHFRQYLRYRNNYAHPSFRIPTRDQTNAAIDNLIDLVCGPPFK